MATGFDFSALRSRFDALRDVTINWPSLRTRRRSHGGGSDAGMDATGGDGPGLTNLSEHMPAGPQHDALPTKAGRAPHHDTQHHDTQHHDAVQLSALLQHVVFPRLVSDIRDQADGCHDHGGHRDFSQLGTLPPAPPRQSPPTPPGRGAAASISSEVIEELGQLCLDHDMADIEALIERQIAAGYSAETIMLDLLAPASGYLGNCWATDSQDFLAVTMGSWRLQETVHFIAQRMPSVLAPGGLQRSALLASAPGSAHSLGTLIMGECFRRAGWDTEALVDPDQHILLQACAAQPRNLVGLTIGHDATIGALPGLVAMIRARSANPAVRVIVGGPALASCPDLAALCGADGSSGDARAALELADSLVSLDRVMGDPG